MASGKLSRAEALACSGCRHACHVMLYAETKTQLFWRIPIRHIVLMQMRFDGLLGFPGGLVNPLTETLEDGLRRELFEELGVAVPVSVHDHVESRVVPPSSPSSSSTSSGLVLHFYVKKIGEEEIKEVERAAVTTAKDHGHEVLGTVRVPLHTLKRGGGLSYFLSHSFIGNARSQLVDALLRFNLASPGEVHKALTHALKTHTQSAEDLHAALALTEPK